MGQGQSWGTVTVFSQVSQSWGKFSFSQVSFWDMARAGQGTAQFQSNSSSYLRGPAANFVCLVIVRNVSVQKIEGKNNYNVHVLQKVHE